MWPAQVFREIHLVGMPRFGSEAARLIQRDAGVVADIYVRVVNPRRPLAGEIDLGAGGPARYEENKEQQNRESHLGVPQRGSSARHGVGSHPDASGSFLKCACMMRGSMR